MNNYNNINTVKCGGLELLGMEFVQGSRRKIANVPILENYTFIPYIDTKNEHDVSDVYSNLVQIVLENSSGIKIKVAEISSDPNSLLSTNVTKAIEVEPLWTVMLFFFKYSYSIKNNIKFFSRPTSKFSQTRHLHQKILFHLKQLL